MESKLEAKLGATVTLRAGKRWGQSWGQRATGNAGGNGIFEGEQHGYVLLDMTHERTQGEWWYVDSITDPASGEYYATGLFTRSGENHLRRAEAPTEARPDAPVLAP